MLLVNPPTGECGELRWLKKTDLADQIDLEWQKEKSPADLEIVLQDFVMFRNRSQFDLSFKVTELSPLLQATF